MTRSALTRISSGAAGASPTIHRSRGPPFPLLCSLTAWSADFLECPLLFTTLSYVIFQKNNINDDKLTFEENEHFLTLFGLMMASFSPVLSSQQCDCEF